MRATAEIRFDDFRQGYERRHRKPLQFGVQVVVAFPDRAFEPGVTPVPVSGNTIPDTPEHTVHLGASYTWDVPAGALTARWDYYWQSESYLTIFNRSAETIDAWDQHNLSLIYETGDGRWSARAWVRNIENDVHILGGYRQHAQQDFSVSEPRAFGVSVRFNFARG